ncbi:MAG: hypothetical protein ACE5EX_06625 [Phycisphaerae bacterium]
MTKSWHKLARKAVPWLSAGVLLQAASCAIDPVAVGQEFVNAVAVNLIAGFVFSAFGVSSGF